MFENLVQYYNFVWNQNAGPCHPNRFSIGFCLRMRIVEFCQESISLLIAAVSCLLLASCSFRVSNSFRFTHCPVSSVGEKFNIQLKNKSSFYSVFVSHCFVQQLLPVMMPVQLPELPTAASCQLKSTGTISLQTSSLYTKLLILEVLSTVC